MKIAAYMILLCIMQVSAASYGQRITINKKNVPLKAVVEELRKQSGLDFIYDANLINQLKSVSVNIKESTVENALKKCLLNQPITYTINDNFVVLSAKKSPPVQLSQPSVKTAPINGRVYDQNNKPIPGATVRVLNSQVAVSTKEDGSYRITVPAVNAVLVFSFIGYEPQSVTVGDRTTINVALKEKNSSLSEVVVVGYGTQKKGDVTTSIASLKSADINDFPSTGLDKAMTGKMAGVQVIETGGAPGSGIAIKVRGTSTITAGTSPLYVIDGVPMSDQDDGGPGKVTNPLNGLNTNDIESIEVLKDASASAIYGSRGSNGVVLISTKKGKKGKPAISYNAFYGEQKTNKKIAMLDAYEYAKLVLDARNNSYLDLLADQNKVGSIQDDNATRIAKVGNVLATQIRPDIAPYLNGTPGLTNTDWQDAVFRTAPIQSHSLAIRGGSDAIKYYISGNYVNQQGIVIESGFKKYSTRLNLDASYGKLKVGTTINFTNSVYDLLNTEGRYSDENVVSSALGMSPTLPVYNPDGSYNFDQYNWGYAHSRITNPVALARENKDNMNEISLISNIYAQYEIARGLTLKSSFGVNLKDWNRDYFRKSTLPSPTTLTTPSIPTGTSRTKRNFNWISENTLNYSKYFNGHSITAVTGFTVQRERSDANLITGTGFQNDLVRTLNYASTITAWGSTIQEWSLVSALARVQYNYKSKYLLSAAIRSDGSSRFGPANRTGYFPSVSVGWNIAEEEFLRSYRWLSTFKLRASYGVTGNFNIGNYAYLSYLQSDNYIFGATTGGLSSGLVPSTSANDDLRWEKNAMVNIGTDIGFLGDKVNLQIDVYNSSTSDMLLNLPIPSTSGFTTTLKNIGAVNNKGIELTLSTNHQIGKLKMSHSANFSSNKNKVTNLGGLNEIVSSSDGVIFYTTKVGQPIASYSTLVTNGIFKNQAETNDAAIPRVPGARPGDFKYIDKDGNNIIDGNDRVATGNYQPKFTYGYSASFNYRLFDFSVSLQGLYGNKIANIYRRYINNMEGNLNNMTDALNRYISENNPGNGSINRANRTSKGLNGQISTWHIEDGSYMRVRNITLGMTVPKMWIKNVGISNARIFISLLNPFTSTNYSGYNPEVSTRDNPLTPGVDYGTYPIAKSYNIGINLDL